ncbi:MAG TPA: 30S ribosomal protein S17 [Thermotogota bacterium]|nr:30S ribosomal protein S17 [Thermotogota bacterium]HRW91367.1 30S ribosomal protein S17 [Thermotogota bacterium]
MPKRKVTGVVVSDRMDKTIVVLVENVFKHSVTKKTIRKTKKYKAHDANNECKVGDTVQIEEHPPISKDKKWMVVQILKRNVLGEESAIEGEDAK